MAIKYKGVQRAQPGVAGGGVKKFYASIVIDGEVTVKRRMLPRLSDVSGFSGILIHRGNTKHDSSGCILVGENKVKGKVINSTGYEKRLVKILTQAQERGEENALRINN
jgi:hypothetical protein